ncbi:MAG TPA: Maf family protein [Steroidobacteraceae bacterium]|nr:Maf family protein [Steroidobacteraceae bacterium]
MGEQEQKRPVLRLASASPRRRQLLDLIGVPHLVTPADIDETPRPAESGRDYVLRLAQDKALAVRARHGDLPVLAADTTVHVDGAILEKPRDEADCLRMLGLLSGRRHEVFTGLCLAGAHSPALSIACSEVEFRKIAPDEMRAYWASGEPQGKAGAYAIQGLGAVFVAGISGSYTGVMGLPLFETAELLRRHGVPVWNGQLPAGGAPGDH